MKKMTGNIMVNVNIRPFKTQKIFISTFWVNNVLVMIQINQVLTLYDVQFACLLCDKLIFGATVLKTLLFKVALTINLAPLLFLKHSKSQKTYLWLVTKLIICNPFYKSKLNGIMFRVHTTNRYFTISRVFFTLS